MVPTTPNKAEAPNHLTLDKAQSAALQEILDNIKKNIIDVASINANLTALVASNTRALSPASTKAIETHAAILGKLTQPSLDKDSKGTPRVWSLK